MCYAVDQTRIDRTRLTKTIVLISYFFVRWPNRYFLPYRPNDINKCSSLARVRVNNTCVLFFFLFPSPLRNVVKRRRDTEQNDCRRIQAYRYTFSIIYLSSTPRGRTHRHGEGRGGRCHDRFDGRDDWRAEKTTPASSSSPSFNKGFERRGTGRAMTVKRTESSGIIVIYKTHVVARVSVESSRSILRRRLFVTVSFFVCLPSVVYPSRR